MTVEFERVNKDVKNVIVDFEHAGACVKVSTGGYILRLDGVRWLQNRTPTLGAGGTALHCRLLRDAKEAVLAAVPMVQRKRANAPLREPVQPCGAAPSEQNPFTLLDYLNGQAAFHNDKANQDVRPWAANWHRNMARHCERFVRELQEVKDAQG